MHLPPRQIGATLLDEGPYGCHWRTLYRILKESRAVRERRNQRVHPPYTRPERVATAPNQVWSMDITTLRGPQKRGLLQVLRDRRHLQSVRGGLDGVPVRDG